MIEIKDKSNSKEVDAEWIVLMEEALLQGLTQREIREFLQERSVNET
ncbi:DNA-binding anti-repressor SinI [Salipaludibacillus neizhouensis]|nr:DNA-binding anti-repressor SinI [Salipaludibacillus neizhouensis]